MRVKIPHNEKISFNRNIRLYVKSHVLLLLSSNYYYN